MEQRAREFKKRTQLAWPLPLHSLDQALITHPAMLHPDYLSADADIVSITERKDRYERERQSIMRILQYLAEEQQLRLKELASVNARILNLEVEARDLHNRTQAPILRLPDIVMTRIFELAHGGQAADDDSPDGPWSNLHMRPELVVVQICKKWRRVALSCPSLWSRFVDPHLYSPSHINVLLQYLRRSGTGLLDVVLVIRSCKKGEPVQPEANRTVLLQDAIAALLPCAYRWKRLAIWIEGVWDASPLLALEEISVPALEVFEIGSWLSTAEQRCSVSPLLFKLGAPALTSVLQSPQLRFSTRSLENVTTLHLQQTSVEYSWRSFILLATLEKLENLTLDGEIFSPPSHRHSNVSPTPVSPRLKHLRVGCKSVARYMWEAIRAPELISLTFMVNLIDHKWEMRHGAFPALKTLVLFADISSDDEESMLSLALATASITHLIICHAESALLYCMRENKRNPMLWPHLETITFYIIDYLVEIIEGLGYVLDMCGELVDWRKEFFDRDCVLRIDGKQLEVLQREYPEWKKEDHGFPLSILDPSEPVLPWADDASARFSYWERKRFDNRYAYSPTGRRHLPKELLSVSEQSPMEIPLLKMQQRKQ